MELTALVSSSFVVAVGKVRNVGAEFFASFVQLREEGPEADVGCFIKR